MNLDPLYTCKTWERKAHQVGDLKGGGERERGNNIGKHVKKRREKRWSEERK